MIRAAGRGLANATLFGVGLIAGCTLLAQVRPQAEVPQVGQKLAWFSAHRDDYHVLFLGTSRVRRHIVPALFDRLAAGQGMRIRSFNLGVDSLASPEDAFVLDRALESRPRNLRWVFVELSYFHTGFADQGPETIRAAYWHDWQRTGLVLRHVMATQCKPLKKSRWRRWFTANADPWSLMATHSRLALQRFANLGRGAVWVAELTGTRATPDRERVLGPALDGFIPAEPGAHLLGERLAAYERELAGARAKPAERKAFDPVAQKSLERMLAKIRGAGAEPILFIGPKLEAYHFQPAKNVAPVLDFADPSRSPELFASHLRADRGHLNTAGAELFTRELFKGFAGIALPPVKSADTFRVSP